MIGPLRRSFAAKLIAGGCVLALIVVGSVAGYLIFSRTSQTRAAAQSNSDNRVQVMKEVLDRFTGAEAFGVVASLVDQQALQQALAASAPATAVGTLFAGGTAVDLSGEILLVTDPSGTIIYRHRSPSVTSAAADFTTPTAVVTALNGGSCQVTESTPTAGGCGVEMLSDGDPAYVVALPVIVSGHVLGVVVDVAPLAFQLDRFQALFGYGTAFVPASSTSVEFRPTNGESGKTDPTLTSAFGHNQSLYQAIYNAPVAGGTTQSVAGSFLPVFGSSGQLTGFIGVEVPLSQFVGDEGTDILVVALISVFVLLIVAIAVVLFVERFVKRPIARLEVGVARIAGGDYTTDIDVRSKDELGRLASNVNRMRDAIAGYIRQVQEARERLDTALERLSGVSRALTTTTTGVPSLQQAVVRTAVSMAAGPASAVLALRSGDQLVPVASEGSPPGLEEWEGLAELLNGETVHLTHAQNGVLVGVPMFYQDRVVGALLVMRGGVVGEVADIDVDVLAVLANNAAIAMENARLFEQERETVRRLLELDSLKTDFLSTIQHELRTPLTAILGLSDLLDMCWGMWDEGPKLDAVRDIQVAAKNLYDIVETIIDYSALEDDNLGLAPTMVPVKAAAEHTLELLGERYKGGLPVPVDVAGDETLSVFADADRMPQVLRAVLDNAVKFSNGQGRVHVGISSVDGGRSVRIEILDEGIGIPEEDLPRIFDRFYQVDNTATRSYGGTGMGLALVKRMVQAHAAQVEVTSVVGEGTRVVLTWPVAPADAPGDGVAGAAADGGNGATPAKAPMKPARKRRSPRPPAVPVQ